ncbi:MAG: hypothetical protein HYY30_10335 [Chloroflexi bacterium]|nr:hypothetical protein [Chloroflexota bacterium]
MRCPICSYQSVPHIIRCPGCSFTFDGAGLEELTHLRYLQQRMIEWGEKGLVPGEAAQSIIQIAEHQALELEWQLGMRKPAPEPKAESAPADESLSAEESPLLALLATQPAEPAEPEPLPSKVVAEEALGPGFSWKMVGTYLLSERTLHAFLALGTFLILASGAVISTINPAGLAPLPHLGVAAATTLVFYVVGYVARQKLRLLTSGAALLAIGGAFIPLDIFTLGRPEFLNWEPSAIWLAASLICLPSYLVSHALLRDRAFAVLTALAGGSELLAVLTWLGVPLEWGFFALAALASAYLVLVSRLGDGWSNLADAFGWVARVGMPLLMTFLLLAYLSPNIWQATFARKPGGLFEHSVAAAWWLGVFFYAIDARLSGRRRCQFVAAWMLPVAFLLALIETLWDQGQLDLAFALLALLYIIYGRWQQQQLAGLSRPTLAQVLNHPPYQVGLFLTLAVGAFPQQTYTSSALTVLILSVTYGVSAFCLRQRGWAYVATFLFPMAFGLFLRQTEVGSDVLPLAWSALSAVLIGGAEVAARRTGECFRPFADTVIGLGAWRSRFASPLFVSGFAVSLLALWLGLSQYVDAPIQNGVRIVDLPIVLALLAIVAIYTLATAARQTSLLLYPATWLFLVPATATTARTLTQMGATPSELSQVWMLAALGVGYLALALITDRVGGHYAKPVYLAAYALSVATMLLSVLDRGANVLFIGLSLLIYAGSAWLVYAGRHPSFFWVVRSLFKDPASTAYRAGRALFLYLSSWLFPAWLLLMMSLWSPAPQIAHYGLVVSLLAPLYVMLGLMFRRIDDDYRLPWYLAGYAMSAIGPLIASPDHTLRVVALAVSVSLYAASARLFRRAAWLYLVALLTPVLMALAFQRLEAAESYYGLALLLLSLAYALTGVVLHHGDLARILHPIRTPVSAYSQPFFALGYVIAALGLGLVANQERGMVVFGFLLGTSLFLGSAAVFRQSLFSYLVAGTLAVAYVLGLTMFPLEDRYYGLGLLPGVVGYLAIADFLRRRLDAVDQTLGSDSSWAGLRLESWSTPFYVILNVGAIAVVIYSRSDESTFALAWWSAAVIHGVSTYLFGRSVWLYPTVGASVAAYMATLGIFADTPSLTGAMVSLVVPTWVLISAAFLVVRLHHTASQADPRWPNLGASRALAHSWAKPLLLWAVALLAISTLGSISDSETGLRTAIAYGLLLAVFAFLWSGEIEAWGAVVFGVIAFQEAMRVLSVPFLDQPQRWAVLALGTAVLAIIARPPRIDAFRMWRRPLYCSSLAVAVLALLLAFLNVTWAGLAGRIVRDALPSLAATTALLGLILVTHGFDLRRRVFVYAGIAALEVGYMVQLVFFEVGQPQLFVLPAGLYLLVVAYLEWRRGASRAGKKALEVAALVLMLGVSLLQAVGFIGAGFDRYFYDTAFFLQSAALLGVGAMLRWKRTFFASALALVLDVFILLVDPVRALNTWYLVGTLGPVMIGIVVFVEQRRQRIPLWIEDWRQRLEEWD